MDSMIFFWFGVSLCFLLLEMGSPGLFFFLSFSLGALASAIVALAVMPAPAMQFIIFLGSSALAFLVLHYWVKRVKEAASHKTNIFTLQGKDGLVTKEIKPGEFGLVKVRGEVWSARSADNNVIKVGEHITITRVRGAHLLVAIKEQ